MKTSILMASAATFFALTGYAHAMSDYQSVFDNEEETEEILDENGSTVTLEPQPYGVRDHGKGAVRRGED